MNRKKWDCLLKFHFIKPYPISKCMKISNLDITYPKLQQNRQNSYLTKFFFEHQSHFFRYSLYLYTSHIPMEKNLIRQIISSAFRILDVRWTKCGVRKTNIKVWNYCAKNLSHISKCLKRVILSVLDTDKVCYPLTP